MIVPPELDNETSQWLNVVSTIHVRIDDYVTCSRCRRLLPLWDADRQGVNSEDRCPGCGQTLR